jgi:hypothetical protein
LPSWQFNIELIILALKTPNLLLLQYYHPTKGTFDKYMEIAIFTIFFGK